MVGKPKHSFVKALNEKPGAPNNGNAYRVHVFKKFLASPVSRHPGTGNCGIIAGSLQGRDRGMRSGLGRFSANSSFGISPELSCGITSTSGLCFTAIPVEARGPRLNCGSIAKV